MRKKKIDKKYILNVYCDMDGVIADFDGEPDGLKRFREEKGFFKKLKPINRIGFEQLLEYDADGKIRLFILSASPNKQADKDKKAWLKYHYPKMKQRNVIIIRVGQNKADFMKTRKGVLLDDYGKNCREWRERGNIAIKIEKPLHEHFNDFMDWLAEWGY